ncbi:MAG: hypothetical protein E7211_15150 [Clostridium lundense]|nr:hypothetical protein [Clostridium lundense]
MIEKKYYYMMLIVCTFSNFIFYNTPYLITHILDGAIVAIFIALIVILISSYAGIYVFNHFKNFTLVEINNELLGKKFGSIISFVSIILNFTSGYFMFMGLIEITRKFLLSTTNTWFLRILLIIPVILVLLNTNKTFLYLLGYLGIIILVGIVMYYLLSIKELRLTYIKGTLIHSLKMPNLPLISIASYFYVGVRHLQAFNTEFGKISYRKTMLIFILIGLPMALLTILIPVSFWGVETVRNIEHPWIASSDAIQVNLFFIERGLYILFPLFLTLGSVQIILYTFVGKSLLYRMSINNKIKKGIIVAILICYVTLGVFIRNTRQLTEMALVNMVISSFFTNILFFILFFLTKRREKRNI